MKSLEWDKVSRDFYRSRGSRFDVHITPSGDWLAVDADYGRTMRSKEFGPAREWCEQRARETEARAA